MNFLIPAYSYRLLLVAFFLTLFTLSSFAAQQTNPNVSAWERLLSNNVDDARKCFSENTKNPDPVIAGEAHRGLSETALFLGDYLEACRESILSFKADRDILKLTTRFGTLATFGRTSEGFQIKEGYEILQNLAGQPGPFCGEYQELLALRYLADGKISKAADIIHQMGSILNWKYIGPFENISNSGFSAEYPPEHEIDFTKTYTGKNYTSVTWHDLKTSPASGWIFMEDYTTEQNAVYYFYCTITSATIQQARLAFGASGTYAVFLNNTRVLADSVFHNTGNDTYIQNVTLHKGENTLLVKIGHEWGKYGSLLTPFSNFTLRFLDFQYQPLTGISVSANPAVIQAVNETKPADLQPQPLSDSIKAGLNECLLHNPGNIDAFLRLVRFYDYTDMTDENQSLVQNMLKKYPKSSLLHGLLYESLYRSKKYTEMKTEAHIAWTLCPGNYDTWSTELQTIAQSGDPQQILKFIEQSPFNCSGSFLGQVYSLIAYEKSEKKNEAVECLRTIEKRYPLYEEAQSILANTYLEQGNPAKAEKQWALYLDHDHANDKAYQALMTIAIKRGSLQKAIDIVEEGLRYKPNNALAYYSIANQFYLVKEYSKALQFIDSACAIMPADGDILNLRGTILQAKGDISLARNAFNNAIASTSDNFNAMENLRTLDKKPGLDSMAVLPDAGDVISKSASWSGRTNENGAILSYIKDILYYPSHSSKERTFLLVYLPTEHAVDLWKEYTIGLNGYYQTGTIARALTIKADGTQVTADRDNTQVVFKSLQPGDCILLEWTLNNYFSGEMSHQIWGSEYFRLSCPAFDQRLRFVTPVHDSIPFQVWGDSVVSSATSQNDYRITTFSRPPYLVSDSIQFTATDWPENPKVTYSTFTRWSQIVNWYNNMTEHMQNNTLELRALADSLLKGATTDMEKAGRIHRYITENIRYSYVPFRQSAWTPQKAGDVIATRMGDCKDMASLGRILLQKAGIPSDLVLVNTGEHQYIGHAFISPDFNHCIAACTIDGKRHFIDFTQKNGALFTLPPDDQAALGLVIHSGTTSPELLPYDNSDKNLSIRTIRATLDSNGTFKNTVFSTRTGLGAAGLRSFYRYLPVQKQKDELRKSFARDYPEISIDSLDITNLDTLSDTLGIMYAYTAKNTVTISGTTAIFPFNFPDKLMPGQFAVEEKRQIPADFSLSYLGASTQISHAELSIPAGWKPLNLPEPVKLACPFGTYAIEFKRNGNTITCDRHAVFSFNRLVQPGEYTLARDFLNGISKADAVQLVFFTK